MGASACKPKLTTMSNIDIDCYQEKRIAIRNHNMNECTSITPFSPITPLSPITYDHITTTGCHSLKLKQLPLIEESSSSCDDLMDVLAVAVDVMNIDKCTATPSELDTLCLQLSTTDTANTEPLMDQEDPLEAYQGLIDTGNRRRKLSKRSISRHSSSSSQISCSSSKSKSRSNLISSHTSVSWNDDEIEEMSNEMKRQLTFLQKCECMKTRTNSDSVQSFIADASEQSTSYSYPDPQISPTSEATEYVIQQQQKQIEELQQMIQRIKASHMIQQARNALV
eukprot:151993_1